MELKIRIIWFHSSPPSREKRNKKNTDRVQKGNYDGVVHINRNFRRHCISERIALIVDMLLGIMQDNGENNLPITTDSSIDVRRFYEECKRV